jgi:hypothetical protein
MPSVQGHHLTHLSGDGWYSGSAHYFNATKCFETSAVVRGCTFPSCALKFIAVGTQNGGPPSHFLITFTQT